MEKRDGHHEAFEASSSSETLGGALHMCKGWFSILAVLGSRRIAGSDGVNVSCEKRITGWRRA